MRATPRITQSAVGSAPPARLVPEPRGTTAGTPSSWHRRSTAATSAVERGNTAARGAAIGRQRVTFIGTGFGRIGDHRIGGQDLKQPRHDAILVGQKGGTWGGICMARLPLANLVIKYNQF